MPLTPLQLTHVGTESRGVLVTDRAVDVIGDVHGCRHQLTELLIQLGWLPDGETWYHPEDRVLAFVGDLINRGPAPLDALRIARTLALRGRAVVVLGNHEHVLLRWLHDPEQAPGEVIRTTVEAITRAERRGEEPDVASLRRWLQGLPWWARFDYTTRPDDALVVVHAAWHPLLINAPAELVQAACLFGPTVAVEGGGPRRRVDWRQGYPAEGPFVLYGHTAYDGPVRVVGRTACLDTGCVFGGHLSAMRWPEKRLFHVKPPHAFAPYPNIKPAPPLIHPYHLPPGAALAWPWNLEGPRQTFKNS